jgi:hypothetical protein
MVIYLLYSLGKVLPAWVDAHNNDLYYGNI